MADKLIIVMANTNPHKAAEMVPPFSQAIVAAAMEFEVEMIFTAAAGEIVRRGAAQSVKLSATSDRTVYDMIREARDAGVKLKVCTTALEYSGGGELIPEVDETVGGAYLISEAMDDGTVVFTY
jgi:predicted peroxiredoxin